MPGGLLEAAHAAVCVPCAVEGAMAGAAYPAWPASLGAGALQRPWTPARGSLGASDCCAWQWRGCECCVEGALAEAVPGGVSVIGNAV
eukprot:818124-Pelagomonas_calceolata.AAC.2